jgi:SAM-dependent methyltransferase
MQSNWEKNFFRDVALDFWRDAIPPAMTAAEVDFLDRTLAVARGAHLLDVPCGNGRHAFALAARGYRVTGIDQSEEEIARARARDVGNAEWLVGDMRALPPAEEKFDGGCCMGNSFAYLDGDDGRRFAAGLARVLKTGAKFVVDFGTAAESILPKLTTNRWIEAGGVIMMSQARYDVRASRLDIDYTFIHASGRETRPSSSYIHTIAEICRMFESAGMEVVHLFGSTAGDEYTVGSPRLILVARAG